MTQDAKLVSSGAYGIVVSHSDQTVSKFIYRPSLIEDQEKSLALFYRETEALKYFETHPVPGVELPVMIGEPQTLYQEDYQAVYRMTRVPGAVPKELYGLPAGETARAYYKGAGRILARFHDAAKDMPVTSLSSDVRIDSSKTFSIDGLKDETNAALETVDEYLRVRKKNGVIHGDFHPGNVMATNNIATGLIDFSYVCQSDNIYSDFVGINAQYQEDFIAGYEEEIGQEVDRHVVYATNISMWNYALKLNIGSSDYEPSNYTTALVNINENLNKMIPVTGYKP